MSCCAHLIGHMTMSFYFTLCTVSSNRGEPGVHKVPQQMKLMGRCFGVADGDRTHDNRNHNPGLYR